MPPPVTRLRNGQPRTRQVGPRRYTAHAAFWHREEADTVAAAIRAQGGYATLTRERIPRWLTPPRGSLWVVWQAPAPPSS
jgi:hypothetical protein